MIMPPTSAALGDYSPSTSNGFTSTGQLELGNLSRQRLNTPASIERENEGLTIDIYHGSVPKTDGGKNAWLFLAGCFVLEALVWGKFIMD